MMNQVYIHGPCQDTTIQHTQIYIYIYLCYIYIYVIYIYMYTCINRNDIWLVVFPWIKCHPCRCPASMPFGQWLGARRRRPCNSEVPPVSVVPNGPSVYQKKCQALVTQENGIERVLCQSILLFFISFLSWKIPLCCHQDQAQTMPDLWSLWS